ncbi:MAG: dihydrofolate reductase [Clostridia bacterium BRH_c25]|nr:MAG: dihydrofolate reductase [Clostridia bacterium BRH_c25]
MKAIAAVDLNWGIGYKGNLLQRIPEDMKFFKQMTLGKVVIMGRETFESLPGKEPLKDRTNIILSRKECYGDDRIIVCHSLNEVFHEIKKYKTEDVFAIGGESVYAQLLPFCTEAYITRIENKYTADKFFTDLDKDEAWEIVSASDLQVYKGINYKFVKYVNNKVAYYKE